MLEDLDKEDIVGLILAGGWFSLPPWATWQPWAKQGLERAARAMAVKGQLLERSPSY